MQKSDSSGAVGIVFNGSDFGRNSGFIPLKVDDPIMPFMAASATSDGNAPMGIPATGFFEWL
jgi:hypothetical protein